LRREESKVNKIVAVSGVAHVASNLTFDSDPNKVIPEVLAGVNEIPKSAGKEPGVMRFVFTSSSTAMTSPSPNREFTIDADVWNEANIKAA
jgi:nucleoside-diphosphate-sugar epimerase